MSINGAVVLSGGNLQISTQQIDFGSGGSLDVGSPSPAELRVSPDVQRVLGRAPRPFADWAASNIAAWYDPDGLGALPLAKYDTAQQGFYAVGMMRFGLWTPDSSLGVPRHCT